MRIYTPNGWEEASIKDVDVNGGVAYWTNSGTKRTDDVLFTGFTKDGFSFNWGNGGAVQGEVLSVDNVTVPTPGVPKSTLNREEALYDARKMFGDKVQATLLSDNVCRMELNGAINDAPDWELALQGLQSLLKKEK